MPILDVVTSFDAWDGVALVIAYTLVSALPAANAEICHNNVVATPYAHRDKYMAIRYTGFAGERPTGHLKPLSLFKILSSLWFTL